MGVVPPRSQLDDCFLWCITVEQGSQTCGSHNMLGVVVLQWCREVLTEPNLLL